MVVEFLRFYTNLCLSWIWFGIWISNVLAKPIDLSPAWQREITTQASSYAQHVALPFLTKELDDLQVPGMSGVTKTPLGKVDYHLNNIKISDVNIKTANVSLNAAHGLSMKADDTSFKVGAHWKYKEQSWPHISDAGTCKISVDDLSLGLTFGINKDRNSSHPVSLSVKDCNLKIGSLKTEFHGGASWLYNLFSSIISKDIKSQLQSHICDSAVKLINAKANNLLETLPGITQTLAIKN